MISKIWLISNMNSCREKPKARAYHNCYLTKILYFPKLFYFIQNSVKNMEGKNIQIWPSLRKVGGKVVLMDLQIYVLDRNFVSNIR